MRAAHPPDWQIRKARRLERSIAVMRLARLGYSNAEIARRIGCHPSTVSRIVQAELRAAAFKLLRVR
jgi:DNA-binding NarL/FixJ family response regulator